MELVLVELGPACPDGVGRPVRSGSIGIDDQLAVTLDHEAVPIARASNERPHRITKQVGVESAMKRILLNTPTVLA